MKISLQIKMENTFHLLRRLPIIGSVRRPCGGRDEPLPHCNKAPEREPWRKRAPRNCQVSKN
jgi:hypothetical protein